MRMNKTNILLAAVAAVSIGMVSTASAQYQVGSDGRALDASNQIGSGGYNQTVGRRTTVTPDDIIYGNVTAGREFRGRVNTFDAREFRGTTTGTSSDQFIRNSAGAPLPGTAGVNLIEPQTFYGQSRAVPPPSNTAMVGATGAYVDTSDALRIDGRLQPLSAGTTNFARPGALTMPGTASDPTVNQSVLTGSPLFGVRELNTDDPYLRDLNQNSGVSDAASSFATPEQRQLRAMQQELQNLRGPEGADGQQQQPQPGAMNDQLQTPFESPENGPLGRPQSQRNAMQQSALSGDLTTGAQRASRLMLPSAAQQSTQYAELQRRLQRYQQQENPSDAAARAFREQQLAAQQQAAAEQQRTRAAQPNQQAQPGRQPGAQPGAQPGRQPAGAADRPTGAARQPGAAPPAAQPQREVTIPQNLPKPGEPPLQVKSLAEGIQAQGLKNVMLQAEDALRRGRFREALMQYEQAEQVAPNNPLVQLGKVNAMLGSTSFARAYPTLRNAFASDPALLLAQYDLRGMYGEEHLARIVKELKFVADVEKNNPEAMFLLAYVAYNSGSPDMAAQYLHEANQRAGGRDRVVQLLQQYWVLPQGAAAPATQPAEINK
jgi:hypothetical protein